MNSNQLVLHSPAGFIVAFGGGVLSFLSPCVLPLVPSYLSMMSGVGAGELASASIPDRRRLLRATLLFVAGFTVVFAILGAGATSLGVTLKHDQWLTRVAGAVIIAAGVTIAGLIQPAWLLRERRFHVSPARLGEWAAPVMGMAFAFGWTPCIGPILSAVLVVASDAHAQGRGEGLLVAYSLGLGVPFVIFGVAFGRLAGVLAFVRRHLRIINLGSGLLLAALGMLLLTDTLGQVSTAFSDVLRDVGLSRLSTV